MLHMPPMGNQKKFLLVVAVATPILVVWMVTLDLFTPLLKAVAVMPPHMRATVAPLTYSDLLRQRGCGQPGVSCVYPDSVDVRIIVLTFDRSRSLLQCLQSLVNAQLDGATAAIEVWIDRPAGVNQSYNADVYNTVKNFTWKHGPVRAHVWDQHVGLIGQWLDSWRVEENSKELAIILEDDTDVSPYFYTWIKEMHRVFGQRGDIASYSLHDDTVTLATGKQMPRPATDTIVMFPMHGNWGFSPHPVQWRLFQDWYHTISKNSSFHPYVPPAKVQTGWYKGFEKTGRKYTMWSQWYFYFNYINHLWNVHSNLRHYTHSKRGLAYNRRETGLHFSKKKGKKILSSKSKLVSEWKSEFNSIPKKLKFYYYDGTEKKDPLNGQGWKEALKTLKS